MFPTLHLLGRDIPAYWACALIGAAVCSMVAWRRHKNFRELQQVDITNTAALVFVGAVIGGRLLSIATLLPLVIRHWNQIKGDPFLLYQVLSNGLVFYGGLFGALLVLNGYCRHYALDRKVFFDYYAPLIPLFHAFGRVGCFLTGCCYGKECRHLGIAFTYSTSAPNGVPFFPIQLVSAVGELVLFILVLSYERSHHREGRSVPFYLLVYALGRWVLEFFRGDEIRGIIAGLSTSQWISMAVFAALIWQYRRIRLKKICK